MLSLQASYELESDPTFQGRAVVAFNVVAHEVLAEPPNTPNYALRINHANAILQRPASKVVEYIGGIIASPAIQASTGDITDAQLLDGVRQVWATLIGIVPQNSTLPPDVEVPAAVVAALADRVDALERAAPGPVLT